MRFAQGISEHFGLIGSRKFLPIFLAQFGGALNDNIFKSALLVMIAFTFADAQDQAIKMSNFAAILFILPYFFLSHIAGQLADRSNKAKMIQKNKIFEIAITCIGMVALWFQSLGFLLFTLALFGAQSAMFGPNKYAVLPQLMQGRDLVKANAHVTTGTFIAILIGTILGALLAQNSLAWAWIGGCMLTVAIFGLYAAKQIPEIQVGEPGLKIDWNPLSQIRKLIRIARLDRLVWFTMLGVSWFWFVGTAYLTQIPALVRFIGGGGESVVTLFLILFITGLAVGCALGAKLSGTRPDVGIAPYALFGLCLAGIDFAIISPYEGTGLLTAEEFLTSWRGFHISLDLFLAGGFGGAFAIPLYTELQKQSRQENRARMIALSNMLNAFTMILSSLLALIVMTVLDFGLTGYLILIALFNGIAAIYFGRKIIYETFRFSAFIVSRIIYRVELRGVDRLPETGAALLVCNHISYADPVIVCGAIRRPIRFVMDHDIYSMPLLNWGCRHAGAIPLSPPLKNRDVYQSAMKEVVHALENGEMVMIFPEGGLSRDGALGEFKRGIEKILELHPAPVYPMAIEGLWNSFFGHGNGKALRSKPGLPWQRVVLSAGDAVQAEDATAEKLQEEVQLLLEKKRGSGKSAS